ncbi:MAG: class I SAM-dependent methyltransferase [Candidatus Woesearchaeota archaeon]
MNKNIKKWEDFWQDKNNNFGVPTPFLLKFAQEHYIRNFTKKKKLTAVDVASGDGRYSIPLALMGFDVTLIEVASSGVERAKKNALKSNVDIKIEKAEFFEVCSEDRQYDVVFCSGFLEEVDKKLHKKVINTLTEWTSSDGINVVKYCLEISGRGKLVDEQTICEIYKDKNWQILFEEEESGLHKSIANIKNENYIRAGTVITKNS